MTPPDSGEREVTPSMPVSEYEKLSEYAKGWHDRGVVGTMDFVSLPLPLAQRILAALETPSIFGSDHRVDLARELRAIVERKP